MKPLLILAVGAILGYLYGFDDAKKHTHPLQLRVAEQIFNKAGGSSRGRVSGDIDARMQGSVR
jgi:hypothetical protein